LTGLRTPVQGASSQGGTSGRRPHRPRIREVRPDGGCRSAGRSGPRAFGRPRGILGYHRPWRLLGASSGTGHNARRGDQHRHEHRAGLLSRAPTTQTMDRPGSGNRRIRGGAVRRLVSESRAARVNPPGRPARSGPRGTFGKTPTSGGDEEGISTRERVLWLMREIRVVFQDH